MAKTDPNRIAAHEGVGARAVELGYRRKNERVYEKEAGDLTLSISFYFNGDDRFADESGVRSKKIEDLMDAADLAKSQYTNNRGRKAHVAKSAIWSWSDENWQGLRAYKEAQRKKWPIVGAFFDWDMRWDRQSPYVLSPYIDKGLWQAVPDAPGCAEISLARWTETIEPWLEAMRDPKKLRLLVSSDRRHGRKRSASGGRVDRRRRNQICGEADPRRIRPQMPIR